MDTWTTATHTTLEIFFDNVVDELKDIPYSGPEDEIQQIEFLNTGIILAKLPKIFVGKSYLLKNKRRTKQMEISCLLMIEKTYHSFSILPN